MPTSMLCPGFLVLNPIIHDEILVSAAEHVDIIELAISCTQQVLKRDLSLYVVLNNMLSCTHPQYNVQ